MVGPAEHSQSKFPTAAAAAARSVAVGNDDAGGRGHVTLAVVSMAGNRATSVDDEDGKMSANKHGTIARSSSRTALKRRLDLQPYIHYY